MTQALPLRILKLFENKPTEHLTIHQVSTKLKRTYPFVHKTVNQLTDSNILNKKIVGRAHEVWPNLKNEKTVLDFALNSQKNKESYLKKSKINNILKEFTQKVKKNTSVRGVVLFGSQVKGKATKKSDIDILIIVSEKNKAVDQFVLSIANTINMSYNCQINPIIADNAMFKDMLKAPEELNVGAETLKAHIVLYGFEYFWRLIGEAI